MAFGGACASADQPGLPQVRAYRCLARTLHVLPAPAAAAEQLRFSDFLSERLRGEACSSGGSMHSAGNDVARGHLAAINLAVRRAILAQGRALERHAGKQAARTGI